MASVIITEAAWPIANIVRREADLWGLCRAREDRHLITPKGKNFDAVARDSDRMLESG